jgi:IgGFc binding protein
VSWASWAVWAAFGAAIAVGCGGSGGQAFPTGSGHDAGTPADTGTGSSSSSSSGGGPEAGGDASGVDASMGGDTGSPIDASLDIAFPDSFYGPEASTPDGGADDGSDESGSSCGPAGITCQGSVAYSCSGGVLTTTDCSQQTTDKTCANGFGCVACQPGTGTCSGNVGTACNATGTGTVTNNCDPLQGLSCSAGQCAGACANLGESYIGCEYYAVTMANNWLNQSVFYFSVSVSNTGSQTATVTVTGGALTAAITQTIAPGALQEIKLPWVPAISCGSGTCNVDGGQPPAPTTGLFAGGGYHIRSTQPVTVYQFNARDYQIGSDYSYSNDASLLIPVNALTGNYRVAAWPSFDVEPGYITVVGTQAGTKVTIGASSALQAGAGITATGGTVTINAGDVLQIASAVNGLTTSPWTYGTDPSGSGVTASAPVEVFGGHACVYIWTPTAACDHIEQIALPLETLRGDYLVTLPYNANGTPQQYVKIIGTTASTHVTFDPPAVEANQTLQAGTVVTFKTTQNFRVYSTDNPPQPFLVAQYMMGEDNFTASDTAGDPSESVAVATAQFRNSYQFVAPANYEQNWVNVMAPTGANITVDGTAVTGFAAIGASSGYGVQHVALSGANNGVHQASGNVPFGIEVYGYGSYTSYMYPGGLNLSRQ